MESSFESLSIFIWYEAIAGLTQKFGLGTANLKSSAPETSENIVMSGETVSGATSISNT